MLAVLRLGPSGRFLAILGVRFYNGKSRLMDHKPRFGNETVMTAESEKDDQQRIYLALRHSEERFRQVVESAPNAIVMIGPNGLIEMVNVQTERMFGYSRNDLLGKPVEILVPERYRANHPGLRTSFFADPVSRPMGAGRDLYGLRKDGSEFPVEIGLNPIDTEEGTMVLSAVLDISARKRLEQRFRQVVESAPNAIVMIGPNGLIEMVNVQTERMFGYSRNDLLGKPVEILVPERYRAKHPGLRTSFFADPVSRPMGAGRDLYGLRKDGSEFPVEIGLNPIDTEEGTMVLSAVVDISARKRLEERVHAINSMLTHMNCVATAGELSSSIAHEINQPLAAMVVQANAGLRWLTKETPDIDEARAAFSAIASAGHRVADVVQSIRAMYKKSNQEKVPVNLDDLIKNVLGLMRVELEKKVIVIQTELTKSLPLVMGHGSQLQQVILNLVGNAAEAMESVSNRRPRVLLVRTATHDPDGVLVSIEDSGTGIDPANIDRIFDAFFTTKSEGMGMGLAICRSIIEAHDGRLWASSSVDHGSVFNILLPAIGPTSV